MEISMTIISDEKGYLDRECPNENCLFNFKVNLEDWENKVSKENVHCPLCGCVESSEKWWTKPQLEVIQENYASHAMAYLQKEIDKTFKEAARKSKRNKYFQMKYTPGKPVVLKNDPIKQSEEWRLDIMCKKCETRYSVIGNAYFCPHCGYNSVEDVFEDSLERIPRVLEAIPEIKKTYTSIYDENEAEVMCREQIEKALSNIVATFQKFAASKFSTLSDKKIRVNDFQMIDKGSELFKEVIGNGYETWLTTDEIFQMNLYFQRRHLIEHNGGMVDAKYIEKSLDTSYSVGQRIVIRESDVYELLSIVRKLALGLKEI